MVIGAFAWWLGYFSDTPDEVSIEAAAAAVSEDTPDASETTEATVETEPAAEGDTATEGEPVVETDDRITGTWSVQLNEDVTFVGYRINEVLNTIGDFEVVGRTPDVTGTMVAEGTSITAVSLVAQMDTVTTDNGQRDRSMRSQALETSEFPQATFELTSPIELGAIPAEGETISVTATGDLMIHGVTQTVDFPLDAQIVGDLIVVVGQLQIQLADFDIAAPSAPIVASVEDTALLELSVAFALAG